VQTLTIGGTPAQEEGSTFALGFDGYVTSAIEWSSTNASLLANIDAALEALPSLGTGNVQAAEGDITSGVGTITLTFGGGLAKKVVPLVSVEDNSLAGTDPTVEVEETTPGVNATYRGAGTGSMLVRQDTGVVYVNTSSVAGSPTWTVIGSQS